MNKDQVKGTVKEASGLIQKKTGEVMGNPSQQAKGMLKQAAREMIRLDQTSQRLHLTGRHETIAVDLGNEASIDAAIDAVRSEGDRP